MDIDQSIVVRKVLGLDILCENVKADVDEIKDCIGADADGALDILYDSTTLADILDEFEPDEDEDPPANLKKVIKALRGLPEGISVGLGES